MLDGYFTWKGFDNYLENLRKILNKNQFPVKPIYKVTKQYLNLEFHKKPFENKTEVKTDTKFFKLPYIGKYYKIAQKKIQNLVKIFLKIYILRFYLSHSRSVTSFYIKSHYHFIFNHSLFTNLFVQIVGFAMLV